MFRCARTTRRDQKAVMLGTFAVGGGDLGVVEAGLDDAGFEIVEDHALGHATKEGKGVLVEPNPGRQ